jgi:hypothetical protein
MTSHGWEFREGLHGRTATVDVFPLPTGVLLFDAVEDDYVLGEFRVSLMPPTCVGLETVGHADVLCFGMKQTSPTLGFGNWQTTPPENRHVDEFYRSCKLPWACGQFWLVCDTASGWIVLGCGVDPTRRESVLLSVKAPAADPRLAAFSHVAVTNWEASPMRVRMTTHTLDAHFVLRSLQRAGKKFDLQGEPIRMAGVTSVCAVPPEHSLHALMVNVREKIASEPLLRGLFATTPPSSYHMTVHDVSGSNINVLVEAFGSFAPFGMPAGTIVSEQWDSVDVGARPLVAAMAVELSKAGISSSRDWTAFTMRATAGDASRITLEPWDAAAADAIQSWRRKMAHVLLPLGGLVFDEGYVFHATISYTNFPEGLCGAVKAAIERVAHHAAAGIVRLGPVILRAPSLCHFTSMAAFHPVTWVPQAD